MRTPTADQRWSRAAVKFLAAVGFVACSNAADDGQHGAQGAMGGGAGTVSSTASTGSAGDARTGSEMAGSAGQESTSREAGPSEQPGSGDGSTMNGSDAGRADGTREEAGTRSAGCGKPVTRPDRAVQQTMQVGGSTRYYLLDVPASVTNDSPLALVLALHGANMNNVSVVGLYNFGTRSNGQAVTVYPQGDGDPPGTTSKWGSGIVSRWTSNEANFSYIEALITELESRYCIDPSRVFATGFSMGGGFTNDLGCQRANLFRAIAPVEGYGPGGLSGANKPTCPNPTGKVAVMITQGTDDTLVTPAMGQVSVDYWTGQNTCNKMGTSSFTGCVSYGGCVDGFPVAYCTGKWGHTIQSDPVTANIWAFFKELP